MTGIRKDVLTFMPLNCAWAQDLLDNVYKTCLSKGPLKGWIPMKIHIVDNPDLEEAFEDRKESLRKMGRTEEELKEVYCFVAESWKAVVSMCKYGIRCSIKKTNILGDTRAGIHLNRNYDMLLKFMTFRNFISARCIVVLKVIPGRTKRVMPRFKGRTLLHPSKHYDSHISVIDADPHIPINEGLANNFIYIYQLDEDTRVPLQHPRQAVPYAVIQVRQPLRYSVGRPFTSFRDRILAQLRSKESRDSTRRRRSERDSKVSSQAHSRRIRGNRSRSRSKGRTKSHSKGRRGRSRSHSKERSNSKGKRSRSEERTRGRSNEKSEGGSVKENDHSLRKRIHYDDKSDDQPTIKKSRSLAEDSQHQDNPIVVLDDKKSSIQTKLQQIEEEIRLRQSKLTELRHLHSNQENSQSNESEKITDFQHERNTEAELQPSDIVNDNFNPKISSVYSTSEHFQMEEAVSIRELSSGASTPTLDEPHYNILNKNLEKCKSSSVDVTKQTVVPTTNMKTLGSNLIELTQTCDYEIETKSNLIVVEVKSTDDVKETETKSNLTVVKPQSTDNVKETKTKSNLTVVKVQSTDNVKETETKSNLTVVEVKSTDNVKETETKSSLTVVEVKGTDNVKETETKSNLTVVDVKTTDDIKEAVTKCNLTVEEVKCTDNVKETETKSNLTVVDVKTTDDIKEAVTKSNLTVEEVKCTDAVKIKPVENIESTDISTTNESSNKLIKTDKDEIAKDPDIRTLFTEAIYKMDPSELYELLTAKLAERDEISVYQSEEKVFHENSSDAVCSDDIGVLDLSCRSKQKVKSSIDIVKQESHVKKPEGRDTEKESDTNSIQIGEHSYSVNSSFFLDNLDILASVASELQAAKADGKSVLQNHSAVKGISERNGEQEYIFNAEDFDASQIEDDSSKCDANDIDTCESKETGELVKSGDIVGKDGKDQTCTGRGRARSKNVNSTKRKTDISKSSGLLKELSSLMSSGIPLDIISTRRRTANSVSAALSASEQSPSDNSKLSSYPKSVASSIQDILDEDKQCLSVCKGNDNSKGLDSKDNRYTSRENLFEKFKSADDIERNPPKTTFKTSTLKSENTTVNPTENDINVNYNRSDDVSQDQIINSEPEQRVSAEENINISVEDVKTEPVDETFIKSVEDSFPREIYKEEDNANIESAKKQSNSLQVDSYIAQVIKKEPGLPEGNQNPKTENDSIYNNNIIDANTIGNSYHKSTMQGEDNLSKSTQSIEETEKVSPTDRKNEKFVKTTTVTGQIYETENATPVTGKTNETDNATLVSGETNEIENISVIEKTNQAENPIPAIRKSSVTKTIKTSAVLRNDHKIKTFTQVNGQKSKTENTKPGKTTTTTDASSIIGIATETETSASVTANIASEENKFAGADLDDSFVDIMNRQVTERMKQSFVCMPVAPFIKQEPMSPKDILEEKKCVSTITSKCTSSNEPVRVKSDQRSPYDDLHGPQSLEISSQKCGSEGKFSERNDSQCKVDLDKSDAPVLITSEINKTIKDLEQVIDLFSEKVKNKKIHNEMESKSEKRTSLKKNNSILNQNVIAIQTSTNVKDQQIIKDTSERSGQIPHDVTVQGHNDSHNESSSNMTIQVITGVRASRNTTLNSLKESTITNKSKVSTFKSSSLKSKGTISKSKLTKISSSKNYSEKINVQNNDNSTSKTNDATRATRVLNAAFKESAPKEDITTTIKKEPITEDEYYGVPCSKLKTNLQHEVTLKHSSKDKREKLKQSGRVNKQGSTKKASADLAHSSDIITCKDSSGSRISSHIKQKTSDKAKTNEPLDNISGLNPLDAIRTSYSSTSRVDGGNRTLFIEDGKYSRSVKSKQRLSRRSRSRSSDSNFTSSSESPIRSNARCEKNYSSKEPIRKRLKSRSPSKEEGRWYVKSKWDANDSPKSGPNFSPNNKRPSEVGSNYILNNQKNRNSVGLLGDRPSNYIGGHIHDQDAFFSSTGYAGSNRKASSATNTKYTTSYASNKYTSNHDEASNVTQSISSSTSSSVRSQHKSHGQSSYDEVRIKRERSNSLERDNDSRRKRNRSNSRDKQYDRRSDFSSDFKRYRSDELDQNSYYRKKVKRRSRDRESSSSTDRSVRSYTPQRSSGSYRNDSSSYRDFRGDHYTSSSSHYPTNHRLSNDSFNCERQSNSSGHQNNDTEINNTLSKAMSTLLKKIIFDDQTSDNSKEGRMAEMVLDMVKARVSDGKTQNRRNENDTGGGSRSVFREDRRVPPDRSVSRELRTSPERSSSRPYNSTTSSHARSTTFQPYDNPSSKLSSHSNRTAYRDDCRSSVGSSVNRVDHNNSRRGHETSYTTSYHKNFNPRYNTIRRPWSSTMRRGISSVRRTWSRGMSSLSYSSRSRGTRSPFRSDSSCTGTSIHSESGSRKSTRDRRSQSK